jgi:hypothetical protein
VNMKAVASPQAQKTPTIAKIPVRWARTGIFVAYTAAGCWIALGLESIIRPEQENYRDWLWLAPFLLTMLTFYFVHMVQSGVGQNMERAGFYFVMVASVLALLGNVGVSLEQRTLATLGFPWGAVLWTVGLIGFGLGTWQAKVLPRYVALTLILLEPLSILTGVLLAPVSPLHPRGGYSAGVEKGLCLALIGMGLRAVTLRDKASG